MLDPFTGVEPPDLDVLGDDQVAFGDHVLRDVLVVRQRLDAEPEAEDDLFGPGGTRRVDSDVRVMAVIREERRHALPVPCEVRRPVGGHDLSVLVRVVHDRESCHCQTPATNRLRGTTCFGYLAPMTEERYGTPDAELEIERIRLDKLADTLDPSTFDLLLGAGIGPGDDVLEAGAGNGSVAVWMADQVGPTGSVLSVDIDLRFHAEVPDHVEVREFDLEGDDLPREAFDLVHTRAVLQHLPAREEGLAGFVDALRPGGRLVVEDGVFLGFAEQALEQPYRDIHVVMATGAQQEWRDPNFGLVLVDRMRRLGLVDLQVDGRVWAMRPGEPAGDWWFLALERTLPRLVAAGITTDDQASEVLDQVRSPDFTMLSPVHLSVVGRKPT